MKKVMQKINNFFFEIIYNILLFLYSKGDCSMYSHLIMLYSARILDGKMTIDEVPLGLRAKVRKYLEDQGYDFDATEE